MNKTILLFLLVSLSCHKYQNDDTIVEGVVSTLTTNQPIKGYKVFIIEKKTTGWASASRTIVDSAFSDENGRYKISFNSRSPYKYNYEIDVSPFGPMMGPHYFNGSTDVSIIKKGEYNPIEVRINYQAEIKFKLDPAPPYPQGDSLSAMFTINVPYKGKYSSGINEQLTSGISIFEIWAGHYDIVITKVKGGVKTITHDTLFLNWQEKKTYIVKY